MKIARALATSWVAVTLLAVFEILWVLVVEQAQPVGYFALGSGLMLLCATLVAVGLAFTQDPAPWVASALAGLGAGLVWSPLYAVAAALAIALLLRLDRRDRVRASTYGVAIAAGLGLSAIVAPRLLTRVPLVSSLSPSAQEAVLVTLLVLVVVGLVGLQSRLYPSPLGRIATPLAALALLSCSALPFVTRGPRPPETSPQPVRASAPLERPHVVLLVLDTVRADHMTLYGYEKPTTPRLEGLLSARPEAAIFPSAYANSNWTVPSHASLFTGLLPSEHGAHFGSGSRNQFSLRDHPTLAEAMRAAGYRTIGIYANPWLGHVEGMERGFDVYRSPRVASRLPLFGESLRRLLVPGLYPDVIHAVPRGDAISEAVEAELLACGDQPCFVFANLIDAHSYYVAESCRGRFAGWSPRERITLLSIQDPPERTAHLMARYDEEICELDRVLAELIEGLEAAKVLDESWMIITSDHGEAFGEHGNTEHGNSAYNDQVWIPLVILPPEGQRIEADPAPASLVDVTATVAALGGADTIGVGRDLRVPADRDASASIEFYGDESKVVAHNPRAADPARAVALGGHKLIEQSGELGLFDLRIDRGERRDLSLERPELVDRLVAHLPELRFSDEEPVSEEELPPEVIEQLRQLGYGH